MEYDLLKEIDAQYLIEYLQDLNTTILSWKDKLNYVHVEYEDLLEFDADNEYAISEKKEEFNAMSKEFYYEVMNKMRRTKLEISSIYSYIIRDKLFLEMISDRELLTYFRECATISEEITKNVSKLRELSLSSKDVKEYKKGYEYNLLDIDDTFYQDYNDEVESLYFEDTTDFYKGLDKELQKATKSTLTLKKMIKNKTITYKQA
ncbi:MAG: hypothetical protein IKJ30_05985 [Bacilli bacterium]|nr:hypothetical protein [Bacilli bacterium]